MSLWRSRADAWLVLLAATLVALWLLLPQQSSEDPFSVADWSDLAEGSNCELLVRRNENQVEIRVERESPTGRDYVAKGPYRGTVDPAATDRLIRALGHLQALRVVNGPKSQFGLDKPTVEVELHSNSERGNIRLGKAAPSPAGAYYAEITRARRSHIVVLAAATVLALDIEPEALLEHRVFDWLPSEFTRVESTDALGPFVLERSLNGAWMLGHSARARANRERVDQLLLALTELSLTRILPASEVGPMLIRGQVTQFELQAKREGKSQLVRLKLGAACPGQPNSVVLNVEGDRMLAGCVDATTLSKIAFDRAAFADNAAFSFHADEVEQLEVVAGAQAWRLVRNGAAFVLHTTTALPTSLGAGNSLLVNLVKVRGEPSGTCDFKAYPPAMKLSLRGFVVGDRDASIEQVKLGPITREGQRSFCRDDGREFLLDAKVAPSIELEPSLLRDPELLRLPIESIAEVRIDSHAGRQLLRQGAAGELELIEPKSELVDRAAIETLRERLASLRAERWLTQIRVAAAQKRERNASVEFVVSGAESATPPITATAHRLALSIDETAPTIGWLDADTVPFELEPALTELLDGLLLDRALLQLTDADRALTLSRGPNQIQLQKLDDHWQMTDGSPSGVRPATIVAPLEHLRGIAVFTAAQRLADHPPTLGDTSTLRVTYAIDRLRKPRLRFEIGARIKWRGTWARYAIVAVPRLTVLLRDEDVDSLFSLF